MGTYFVSPDCDSSHMATFQLNFFLEALLLTIKLTNWVSMEPTNPEHWYHLRVYWFQRGTIFGRCTKEVPRVEHVVPWFHNSNFSRSG